MKHIFVSYSAQSADATTFVDQVTAAIDGAKDTNGDPLYVALIDRKLNQGPQDLWRPVLYDWMMLCDAAVIIIDSDAPQSTWLPREAMVFRFRRQVDQHFRLVPVLRGVQKTLFNAPPFVEQGLEDAQYLSDPTPQGIVDRLKTVAAAEAVPRELEVLEGLLRWPPENDVTRFTQARKILSCDDRTWFSMFSPAREIAARLIGYGFRKGPFGNSATRYPGPRAVRAMTETMPKGHPEQIRALLSAYWVDRAAAGDFYDGLRRGSRLIVLRVHRSEPEQWPTRVWTSYVNRIRNHLDSPLKHVALPHVYTKVGTGDALGETRDRIYSAIWEQLIENTGIPDRDAVRDVCEDVERDVVLRVDEQARVDPEHLITIQAELPGLRIVLVCSDDRLKTDPRVHYIQPELTDDIESTAYRELNVSQALI